MNDRFGVALRPEAMPPGDEAAAQFLKVVDLAVEHDADGAVLVGHRLAGVRREVDDAEAAEADGRAAGRRGVESVLVRTAMRQLVAHRGDNRRIRRLAVESQFSTDSTHVSLG